MSKKNENTAAAEPKAKLRRKILIWTGTAAGIALAYVFVRTNVTVEVSTEETTES